MKLSREFIVFETALRNAGADQSGLEWWAFGSSLHGEVSGADFDVLLIYSTFEDLEIGKACVASLPMRFEVDLICMTPDEANETDFVLGQRCARML